MFFFWTIIPAVLFAVSNLLQKVGLNSAQEISAGQNAVHHAKSVLKNLAWWSGISIAFFATLGYYAALAKYNISLVQPIMALNPVLTALGGWLLLKEHLDRQTLIAILSVVAGLIFAGTLHSELAGQEKPIAISVFGIVLAIIAIGGFYGIKNAESRLSLLSGIAFGLSAVFMKSAESYFHTGFRWENLTQWEVIWRVLAYVATYLTGFFGMQVALAKGRSLLVVPMISALGMLVPSLAGILVFQEPLELAKAIALILVFVGSMLFIRIR